MTIENLMLYSAQVAIIAALGWGLSLLLWEKHPKARLLHWQLLLAACLVLPLLGPRYTPPADFSGVTISSGAATTLTNEARGFTLPDPAMVLLWLIGAGSLLFLLRMTLGCLRIHLYRRRATPMEGPVGDAEIRLSHELNSPITFGWLRPVIILPRYFPDLPEAQQRAVLTHELTHVRRRDWLFTIIEESIRSALWFHPAIWFLLARIQLEREQVVDHETITITGSKDVYLDALLAVAGLKSRFDFVPAPLFLRRRHLAQRVATVLKEVSPMNPKRMFLSLAASSVAFLAAGAITSVLLPLRAPAQQSVGDPGEVLVKRGPKLIQQARAMYPPVAKLKRIEGVVTLEVSVAANGLVTDARVLNGPDELRRSALQAVLQWQFEPGDSATRAEVEINFRIREAAPSAVIGVLRRIEFVNVPPELQRRIAPRIPVKEGDLLTNEVTFETNKAIAEIAGNFRASLTDDNVMRIEASMGGLVPGSIRVGGNVQSMKLKNKVAPVYPPLAKQARIQGTVRFMVRIDKQGKIANMELIAGHPLLVTAAQEAVRQWEYETTMLNGNPVEVMTQVDINFTLSEPPPPPAPNQ
jgi:TonB family protein